MLEPTRVWRDQTGRILIEEADDRDTAINFASQQAANVLGVSAFSEVSRFDLLRARRGQLVCSVNAITNGSFTGSFVAVEINVVGYVSGAPVVLMRSALTSRQSQILCMWDVPQTYNAIGIEARQIVDGVASGVTTGISTLSISAAGTYWR